MNNDWLRPFPQAVTGTKTIHVTMPGSFLEAVDSVAKTNHFSRSEFIRYCLLLEMRRQQQYAQLSTPKIFDSSSGHPPFNGHWDGHNVGGEG